MGKPNELIDRATWNSPVCPPVVRIGRFVGDPQPAADTEKKSADVDARDNAVESK